MSEYSDGDCCEVFSETTPKARKEHRCHACGETITPGRVYSRTFTVFEGDPDTIIRCERCQALFEHLSEQMSGNSEEYCNATLSCGHEYEERWGEPPPEEIAALAFWLPGDPLP
jgi:hypothetical protein